MIVAVKRQLSQFQNKPRGENKCRLSLGESSVFPFFRGAKGDNKRSHDAKASALLFLLFVLLSDLSYCVEDPL